MDDRTKLIGEYWYDWITDGSKENDVEDAGGISVVDRAESRVVKRESRRLVVVVGAESTCTSEEQEHAGLRQRNKGAERIPGLDDSSEILWQESYLGGLGIGQAVGSDNLAGAQNGALPLIFSLFCRGSGRLM